MKNIIYLYLKAEKKMRLMLFIKDYQNQKDKVRWNKTIEDFLFHSVCLVFYSFADIEILYDSSILFSERLYAKLGLDITHVKLSKNLRDIISQPLIFVRENLAKDTFDALDKLNQVIENKIILHRFNSVCSFSFSWFMLEN